MDVAGVRFAYEGATPVLAGVDFRLAPGEVVALVGATGAGKSTLCNLLAHLQRPSGGVIRVGGVALDDAEPADVRRRIALAFQEAFLFGTTIRDNLALGEDVTDADLRWALAAPAPTASSTPSPTASTNASANAASPSPAASANASPWPAPAAPPRPLLLDDATAAVDPTVEQEVLDQLRAARRHHADHRPPPLHHHRRRPRAVPRRRPHRRRGSHDRLVTDVPAYAALARAYEAHRP